MTSQAIQESQGFENPLKPAIRAAFAALTTDYGEKFTKQFRTVSDDGIKLITPDRWQYRLMHLLAGMEDMPNVVVDAVNGIGKRGGNCPTVVEIVAECRALRSAKYRAADERREIERHAKSLPHKHQTDPKQIVGMLADAVHSSKKYDREAWLKRKREAIQHNENLIAEHRDAGKIRRPMLHTDPRCAIGGCNNPGSLSHSTQGTSEWYCREHFRA